MVPRIKILDIELSRPLKELSGLADYSGIQVLLRWQDYPLGYLKMPVNGDSVRASTISAAINRKHRKNILRAKLRRRLDKPLDKITGLEMTGISPDLKSFDTADDPLVSVVVCTRGRTQQLQNCLDSLGKLNYSNIEILVIDNAPATDETKQLVQTVFPDFRYIIEPRPGLDWARNCAIKEACGEIIAYTDDDVMVDPLWISALVNVFQDDPAVMAVTGMVAAYELETRPQIYFELNGGFGRGFKRQWFKIDMSSRRKQTLHFGAGRFGTGANMAFRRTIFDQIGGFDPALDVGTVTRGGGDLEMFFRVLEEGYCLVYEPAAVVWHQHRKTFEELRTQLRNNGIGLFSYFVRSATAYPHLRWPIIRFGLWWFWRWNVRRLLKSFIKKPRVPRELILAELRGSLAGLTRYARARRQAQEIEAKHAPSPNGSLQSTRSIWGTKA